MSLRVTEPNNLCAWGGGHQKGTRYRTKARVQVALYGYWVEQVYAGRQLRYENPGKFRGEKQCQTQDSVFCLVLEHLIFKVIEFGGLYTKLQKSDAKDMR